MKKLNNKVDYGDEILSNDQILSRMGKGHFGNGWMDAECVDLCNAINSMKGLETIESCCGHNDRSYRIFFKCHSIPALRFLQSCIDNRYWQYGHLWSITSYISDTGPEQLGFMLESKSSKLDEIMPQVEDMIRVFNHYLNHEGRFNFLGLDYDNFIFEEVEEIELKSNLEEAYDVIAQARGVVELGGVSFSIGDNSYNVDIEESNVHGHHEFKVFLRNPDENLNPETCEDTGEVLDTKFVQFIQDEYRSGTNN